MGIAKFRHVPQHTCWYEKKGEFGKSHLLDVYSIQTYVITCNKRFETQTKILKRMTASTHGCE